MMYLRVFTALLILTCGLPSARASIWSDYVLPIGGALVAIAAATVALGALGFTGAGIAAGSYAAYMMSAAATANGGGVAAGSLVAIFQSFGAAGFGPAIYSAIGAAGALLTKFLFSDGD